MSECSDEWSLSDSKVRELTNPIQQKVARWKRVVDDM